MLTSKDIEKASRLIAKRGEILNAKWDALTVTLSRLHGSKAESFDDELAFAVEEFRGRRITAIDAELKALGVDPTQAPANEEEDDPEAPTERTIVVKHSTGPVDQRALHKRRAG